MEAEKSKQIDNIVNGTTMARFWDNVVGFYQGVNRKGYEFTVTTGLCVGSGDKIGFQVVKITPDMVGRYIAQFGSIEVKDRPNSIVQPGQIPWRDLIIAFGGAAIITHTPETVLEDLKAYSRGVEAPPDLRKLAPLLVALKEAKKRKRKK